MLEILRDMDHAYDFIYVLSALYKIIEHNIALHLLLDVGKFLRQITVTTILLVIGSTLVQGRGHVMYTLSFQGNNGKGLITTT